MRRAIRRFLLLATVAVTAAITAAGCGFGRADDTGLPIPGGSRGWICPGGDAPDGDAGCPPADGGASDANGDAGVPTAGSPGR